MSALQIDQLSIRATRADGRLRLDWRGTGRIHDADTELCPFLDRASAEAVAAGALVELHIEETDFFNSATMGAVIRFIKVAQKQRLGVELFFDPGQDWQRLFAEALAVFERRGSGFALRPR